jgi:predicted ATPase
MNRTKLSYIAVRGYKSISYDKPFKLDIHDINILLGANGAGKSNMISFFKMLGAMMKGNFQRYIAISGTNQKFLYYGPKRTPVIDADICFENESMFADYKFRLANAVPERLIISHEKVEWKEHMNSGDPLEIALQSDFNESALTKPEGDVTKLIRDTLSNCKVYQFNDSSITSPMRQSSPIDTAHYLQSEANNLAPFLYYLKNNYTESYDRIVDYVQGVVPQFHDFYLEPENGNISLKWTDNSVNDYVLSSDQFSDGSIRFIALATLLLQPEKTMPNVIIIDEPELGLHPYAIEQLTEMIKDASLHAQIIAATQSPTFIDGVDMDDVTIIERDEDNQCTMVNKLDKDGQIK